MANKKMDVEVELERDIKCQKDLDVHIISYYIISYYIILYYIILYHII